MMPPIDHCVICAHRVDQHDEHRNTHPERTLDGVVRQCRLCRCKTRWVLKLDGLLITPEGKELDV